MQVHERVRGYIEENGIDTTILAKNTQIPHAVLCAILNGKRTMYADELRGICQALRVRPERFIDLKSA